MRPRRVRPEAATADSVVLWTGGKDSVLALHQASSSGRRVEALVTFAPLSGAFRAHPERVMRAQATALGIPHRVIRLRPPYRVGYRRAFRSLQRDGIRTIITGDIDQVGGCANWVRSIAEPMGLEVLQPMWRWPRARVLERLARLRFEVIVSYVDSDRMSSAWVGRRLDGSNGPAFRDDLRNRGLDAAGENGEYHTWVLDAPMFRARLVPTRTQVVSGPRARWLRVGRITLATKRPRPEAAGTGGPITSRGGRSGRARPASRSGRGPSRRAGTPVPPRRRGTDRRGTSDRAPAARG